jgi:hypothetical protein
MHLTEEISRLDQHTRTMQLVIASLVAAREQLSGLPAGPQLKRLMETHQQTIDAAQASLDVSMATLAHLRKVDALYVTCV